MKNEHIFNFFFLLETRILALEWWVQPIQENVSKSYHIKQSTQCLVECTVQQDDWFVCVLS